MQKLISGNRRYIVHSKTLLLSIIDRGRRPRSLKIMAFPELLAEGGTEISASTKVEQHTAIRENKRRTAAIPDFRQEFDN